MTRPTLRQTLRGTWAHRPAPAELLFWAVLVAISHWLIDIPVVALTLIAALVLVGGSLYMALSDLRGGRQVERGGDDAH
jgi:uncharacterized membrane protein